MHEVDLRETLLGLAEPVVRALGLVVWGVEIAGTGRPVLRLFVDAPPEAPPQYTPECRQNDAGMDENAAESGVGIGQCEEISRQLSLALDVEDMLPEAHVLEVSSPGLDRMFFTLEQMRRFVGDMVEARLSAGLAGRRRWMGRIVSVGEDSFDIAPATLSAENGDIIPEGTPPVRIPWQSVRLARRVPVFRKPPKPGKHPGKKR